MRKLASLMGLLLVLAVGVMPAAAITWGQRDGNRHPNVGAIVVDHPVYGLFQICTGALVHPRVFLTAAHCTSAINSDGYKTVWVNFDEYALSEPTLLKVAQAITHPDYNWGPTSNPHEVGVLILQEPVTGIEPANLPPIGFLDQLWSEGKLRQGKNEAGFVLVGYGGTLDWPPSKRTYEDYRQFAESEFQALLKAWLRMSQNRATGDGGTCYGDSGGPAFWTEPDGSEILVGVTSWGDASCVSAGFNYRTDISDTQDFVAQVIADLP